MSPSRNRGSPKHKNKPPSGTKRDALSRVDTRNGHLRICNDPLDHDWKKTLAHDMFEQSEPDPDGSDKRYATMNGIAFVAQPTEDGTWHGYPEPWNKGAGRAQGKMAGRGSGDDAAPEKI